MSFKSILVLLIITISIFLIYIFNKDTKIYYLNISDTKDSKYSDEIKNYYKKKNKLEKYITYSNNDDFRITDLIRDINDNIEIKDKQKIQNALIKADVITLKMGSSELNYKAKTSEINEMYEYSDTLLKDIEELFKLIRTYSKEDIYFIKLENTNSLYYDELYNYLNLKIKDIGEIYNIKFIDTLKNTIEIINKNSCKR